MNCHRTRVADAARFLVPLLVLLAAPAAQAVPSFARQTGMACEACHTVWPELTHFGRVFKANGYVLENLKPVRGITAQKEEILSLSQFPPLSLMVQVAYTQLDKALPDGGTGGTTNLQNGNVAFPQQISLFYAGKIAPHAGAFIQLTYENSAGTIGIDNADIRIADLKDLPGGQSLIYGLSLNNNPTVQDLWNSTPAFGFPYAASNAAPGPSFGAKIDGALGQDVAGLTGYVWWNESLYGEVGLYRTARQGTDQPLGSGSGGGVLSGTAPYFRLAYEHNWGRHSLEAGLYGATFKMFPTLSSGLAPVQGASDRYQDLAQDLQYQFVGDKHFFSLTATRIHEKQSLDATYADQVAADGDVGNLNNDLTTVRAFATYYYKRKIGGTFGLFKTTGSTDAVAAPDSPDSKGWIAEVNYMPWLNTKFSVQYTSYSKLDGLSDNVMGIPGRKASDNNTLYIRAWLSY
jgi:hypothetical protein